jgi:transposase-like protein
VKTRGLRPPLLVIGDGAAGLVGAIERTMAGSLRQRCLIHRCGNVLAKVPARAQAQIKAAYWAIFDVPAGVPPGERAEALVQQRIQAFAATYHTAYPAAVRCLQQDQQPLTAYLRFPGEHWHRIRHSNFIERTFGQTRRRVKVIGRLPGQTSRVCLVWAVLDRASRGWPGFTITATGTRLPHDLRRQILDPPTQLRPHARNVHQPAAAA